MLNQALFTYVYKRFVLNVKNKHLLLYLYLETSLFAFITALIRLFIDSISNLYISGNIQYLKFFVIRVQVSLLLFVGDPEIFSS